MEVPGGDAGRACQFSLWEPQHHLRVHLGGTGITVIVAGVGLSGSTCIATVAAINPSDGQMEWQTPVPSSIEGALTEVPGLVAVGAGPTVDLLSTATGEGAVLVHRKEQTATEERRLRRTRRRVLGASDHRRQHVVRCQPGRVPQSLFAVDPSTGASTA